MKILLRDAGSGEFLCGADRWTANPDAAYDWRYSKRLLDYVRERGLEGMEIAIRFPGSDSVEIYPLQAAMQIGA